MYSFLFTNEERRCIYSASCNHVYPVTFGALQLKIKPGSIDLENPKVQVEKLYHLNSFNF